MAKKRSRARKTRLTTSLDVSAILMRWLQFLVALVVLGVIYSGIAFVIARGNQGRVEGFVCIGAGFLMFSGVWWWFSKRPER